MFFNFRLGVSGLEVWGFVRSVFLMAFREEGGRCCGEVEGRPRERYFGVDVVGYCWWE